MIFNAKYLKLCFSDKFDRAVLEFSTTTTARYSQLINKLTHFVDDVTYNASLAKNCAIEQSIYGKCHHDIIFGTLYFSVRLHPPYSSEMWDYKNAEINSIQNAISNFDWRKAFKNK